MKKKIRKRVNESIFGDLGNFSSNQLRDIARKREREKEYGRTPAMSLGGMARAALGSFKYGRNTRDQYAANKFVDDFVRRGLEVLNVAVKQGIVDPNQGMTSSNSSNSQPQNPPAQPAAPPSNPVQENRYYKVNKLTDLYEGWLNDLYEQTDPNPNAPVSGRRELSQSPDAIRKRKKRAADRAARQASQPQSPVSPNQTGPAPAVPTPPSPSGPTGPTPPNPPRPPSPSGPTGPTGPTPPRPSTSASTGSSPEGLSKMAQYFKDTFLDDYLQGIDNQQYIQPKIDDMLKNLPELYKTKKLEKVLQDLGHAAWTLGTGRR